MLTDFVQIEERLKSDQAEIDLDKINLKYCSITSPVNGVIVYIKIDEGNIITSSGDIIANVKEIDPLYVDFNVPEKRFVQDRKSTKRKRHCKSYYRSK